MEGKQTAAERKASYELQMKRIQETIAQQEAFLLTSVDPKAKAGIYSNLAMLYCNGMQDIDKGLPYFDSAHMLDPSADTLYSKLKVLMREERYEDAKAEGMKILTLDPNYMDRKFMVEVMFPL